MGINLMTLVSFAIVFNCVISVAKNSEEKVQQTNNNVTDPLRLGVATNKTLVEPEIFSEGSHNPAHNLTNASRSRSNRKGVNLDTLIPPTNETTSQASSNISTPSVVASPSLTSNVSITSIQNITVPSTLSTVKLIPTTTRKPRTTTSATTSTSTTTTTQKPIRKPTITYSADDNAQILESEKNINYNVTTSQQLEDVTVPKTSSDTDRTLVDDEKSTRRSYVVFMGLAFALPMTFTLMHVMYKKIRNWMEIRHYQRVVSWDLPQTLCNIN